MNELEMETRAAERLKQATADLQSAINAACRLGLLVEVDVRSIGTVGERAETPVVTVSIAKPL